MSGVIRTVGDHLFEWTRVSKPVARKAFEFGLPVKVVPCKVSGLVVNEPERHLLQCSMVSTLDPINGEDTFDARVDAFSYYNCQYSELGRYPHYYIQRDKYDERKKDHD